MNTTYTLWYDHPDSEGKQIVWDNDRADGLPYHYKTVQDCFMDFLEKEAVWGRSEYVVPPQIREVTWFEDPNTITETGKAWAIQIGELSYVAVPA